MPNALAHEKSPYLLQHADNPVQWLPWGPPALEKARAEQKPIFLSIGYATCHWCHVMAHESFEDEEVARLLNEHFVPIKVDREERPDLDGIYMTACQALSGAGGWPLSVFLTPEGKPFLAGTYFPKTSRFGRPGFIELLAEIAKRWGGPERDKMIAAGDQVAQALQPKAPTGAATDPRAPETAFRQLLQSYDQAHGGFGNAPKFPTPHNLGFLLRLHARQPEGRGREMVEATLRAMRQGGIFDQVGHGFHRYSVDAKWLVPHFEKMLYDQALLALAYLEAHQLGGAEDMARTAREVFGYVLGEMTDPEGGFYSAEDADSEGHEGKYYVWRPEEVIDVCGPRDGDLFNRYYDITEAGNFENGWSIPHVSRSLESFAAARGLEPEAAAQALESARLALLARRRGRVAPQKDDKVLCAWNGLMIAALAKGAAVLGDEAYLGAAERAADFVLRRMRAPDGALLRRWRRGHTSGPGFLDDYAFFIWGLLELYEASQDLDRLEQALDLRAKCDELFLDPADGAYFLSPADGEELIYRDKEFYDGATPAGNSVMALNLLRLGRLVGDSSFDEAARRVIDAPAAQVMRHPMGHCLLLSALDFAKGPSMEIVISGPVAAAETRAMLDKARRAFIPARVIMLRACGPQAVRLARLAPFTKDLAPVAGRPTAFICQGQSCSAPITDPDRLEF